MSEPVNNLFGKPHFTLFAGILAAYPLGLTLIFLSGLPLQDLFAIGVFLGIVLVAVGLILFTAQKPLRL